MGSGVVGLGVIGAVAVGGVAFAGIDRSSSPPPPDDRTVVEVRAHLRPAAIATTGFSHDPKLAPPGALVKLRSVTFAGKRSTATLTVRGLARNRPYVAHVHVNPCGVAPLASGGHYLDDPKGKPDAANEVWFTFTTGPHGEAVAKTRHPWTFAPTRLPRSIVLHDPHGTASPPTRLACVNIPFAP
ncbi:hypothetical protein [Actinocorallia lasiicapitis]